VVLYLRAAGLVDRMNGEALLLLVVGMLLADDKGEFTEQSLLAATSDPSVLQIARTLIERSQDESNEH
jgi:hypothetical protein